MLSSDDDYECESLETLRMELEELKERGNQLRLEYRRELQSLRSDYEPISQNLHAKHENRADHSIYHQIMEPSSRNIDASDQSEEKKDGGFQDVSQQMEEQEPQFTPFVRKIQSQLCCALHQQEVNQRQIKFSQRSNKRLIVFLSTEIEAQKAISKKRSDDFEAELKETESANQVMMDMLEKDAVDQEEVITSLRLQLGMDPTPNSQRKNFRQRNRRRIQRLSGGLRNLGKRVRQTPRNIRDSKVWKDLMAAEINEEGDELDASERRGVIRRLRRSRNMDEGNDELPKSVQQEKQQEPKSRFHRSKVEKLSLDDIEDNGRLGLVGRIRRSRQMRQGSHADVQEHLDNSSLLNDKPQRQPLQGVRRRASEFRGLFRGQNNGKSIDSDGSNASTEPPTPPNNEKSLYAMDDDMFAQEIYALSI
ncbi:unnamed protein product [Cylindrotheca closterium]|uniref:Uncharacterized protein n=1 Tax=Cylindrotheca closterium TaxID=2856 RepID=A0AAD2G6T1_9STRA|nr:unnamed protein product [Cylindrotheca closterium]